MTTTHSKIDSGSVGEPTSPSVETAFDTVDVPGPDEFPDAEDPDETERNCKDDAVSPKIFEHLVESTYKMDEQNGLEARFILFMAGRLGLRAGEIAHMDENWIDWRRSLICIPSQYDCEKGRDGGICGLCKSHARDKAQTRTKSRYADYHDKLQGRIEFEPGRGGAAKAVVNPKVFYGSMWTPKTDNAKREIAFDSIARAGIVMDRFFERYDAWPWSQIVVNRRVNATAEECRHIDPDDLYPHALRATAATLWSEHLGPHELKQLMGWANLATAKNYISESTRRLSDAMRNAMI